MKATTRGNGFRYGSVIGGPICCRRTHVVKRTKHYRLVIRYLTTGKGAPTFNLISASAIACAIPTPSSGEVPLPTSSISTKDLGVARPTKKSRGTAEARGSSTYRVSLHNLPSHSQTCSNSSPCRHRLKVERAENRAPYTNVYLRLTDFVVLVTHPKLAYSAGIKHPHIPMIVRSPTCLRYVLFPT